MNSSAPTTGHDALDVNALPDCTIIDLPLREATGDELRAALEALRTLPPYQPRSVNEWVFLSMCSLIHRRPFSRDYSATLEDLKRLLKVKPKHDSEATR